MKAITPRIPSAYTPVEYEIGPTRSADRGGLAVDVNLVVAQPGEPAIRFRCHLIASKKEVESSRFGPGDLRRHVAERVVQSIAGDLPVTLVDPLPEGRR